MNSRKRLHHRCLLIAAFSLVIAFLGSGCLWGFVRDAETGDPLSGIQITYTDADGNVAVTTTNASGFYAVDIADGPVPKSGPVSFQLAGLGYQPLTAARMVEYNDNPNASFANLSSFWEKQDFALTSAGMKISVIELQSVEITDVETPPLLPGATIQWSAKLSIYGSGDPLHPTCEQDTPWATVMFPLATESVDIGCITPGTEFLAAVTVTVERSWNDPAAHLETDVSTATFGWAEATADSQGAILDSTDSPGPDDDVLTFNASIRYKTATVVPLWCEE